MGADCRSQKLANRISRNVTALKATMPAELSGRFRDDVGPVSQSARLAVPEGNRRGLGIGPRAGLKPGEGVCPRFRSWTSLARRQRSWDGLAPGAVVLAGARDAIRDRAVRRPRD